MIRRLFHNILPVIDRQHRATWMLKLHFNVSGLNTPDTILIFDEDMIVVVVIVVTLVVKFLESWHFWFNRFSKLCRDICARNEDEHRHEEDEDDEDDEDG